MKRAIESGMAHMMVTGGSLKDSREALELARQDGIHV